MPFPHVLGNDFAGTVTEVGDGVTAYAIGDEVFGHEVPRAMGGMLPIARPSLTTGTLAEFAVFEADTPFVARRPPELDVVVAAALPTVGLTANAIVATAKIRAGEKVLVIGATGGLYSITFPPPKPARLDIHAELILDTEGKMGGVQQTAALTPRIAKIYSMSEAPAALSDFTHRHTLGKLVVRLAP
ncbi:alcohol dehydrogenase catalytic domain-containing protein [Actinoplanes sp. NPDC026619]|uniref:alcohol dehydrogenase catalytic domain-containing protein n=1 Tax=Actinoplanes sp. NPDC026619 TaxID=3155798 RepID=UPI0033D8AE54